MTPAISSLYSIRRLIETIKESGYSYHLVRRIDGYIDIDEHRFCVEYRGLPSDGLATITYEHGIGIAEPRVSFTMSYGNHYATFTDHELAIDPSIKAELDEFIRIGQAHNVEEKIGNKSRIINNIIDMLGKRDYHR